MADATLTSQQLARLLHMLETVVSQAQAAREVIIDSMASRRREAVSEGRVSPARRTSRRRTR